MKKKILIVEDEMIIAEDINVTLQKFGYSVVNIVPTGKRALESIEKKMPDLVLMDIKLRGDIDGIQTSAIINKKYDIPIVYLTANADLATYEEAKLTSPFGYLIKPFKERELHATIEMAFYKSEAERKIKESREKIIRLHQIALKVSAADNKKKIIEITFEAMKQLSDSEYCAFIDIAKDNKIEISEEFFRKNITPFPVEKIKSYIHKNSSNNPMIISNNDIGFSLQKRTVITFLNKNTMFVFTTDKERDDLSEKIELVELLLGHIKESFKRIELEDKLRRMAIIDSLTGCYNRHYLNHIIEREKKQSKRYKSSLAVMMIDVNDLKKVNDNYGHNIGDFVIRKVADIILTSIRESDIAIRYGGDEFLVIMPHTGKDVDVSKKRIENNIKLWNLNNSHLPFPISIAIGYAYWEPTSGVSLDDIISVADKEMYKNKVKMKKNTNSV